MSKKPEYQILDEFKQDFRKKTGVDVRVSATKESASEANFSIYRVSLEKIAKLIMDYTGWTGRSLFISSGKKGSRKDELVMRRALVYFIGINNGCSLIDCAKLFDRHHTTIINGINEFQNVLETNYAHRLFFRQVVTYLKENYHIYKSINITKETLLKTN